MLLSILVYASLLVAAVALLSLARPLRRLGIATRGRAVLVLLVVVAIASVAMCAPVRAVRVTPVASLLDEFSPSYHVNEVHRTQISAPPERAYAAITSVAADEIALFNAFTWIRRFGRPGPESILNAPAQQPLLDVATRTTFLRLADVPPREVVVGTIVLVSRREDIAHARALSSAEYRDLSDPGFVKATMSFRVEPNESGSLVTTETRVFGTDDAVMRRFLPYWRVILPGSAILRVTWLQAIRRRAER